jgi:hypothetical protein
MSDTSTGELGLRATEAQMRRALGLENSSLPRTQAAPSGSPITTGTAHAQRRHFVRDGEVSVSVVHHDDGAGTNMLDAARQALREQIAAREQVEQLLQEARATIQALETKLAHERIATEEMVRRLGDERQVVARQLEEELGARQQAIAGHQGAQGRLRKAMAAKGGPEAFQVGADGRARQEGEHHY